MTTETLGASIADFIAVRGDARTTQRGRRVCRRSIRQTSGAVFLVRARYASSHSSSRARAA